MKKMPDESSSIEEIENFRPQTMFGSWYWHGRKQELLKFKKSKMVRIKWKMKQALIKSGIAEERDCIDVLLG